MFNQIFEYYISYFVQLGTVFETVMTRHVEDSCELRDGDTEDPNWLYTDANPLPKCIGQSKCK